MTRKLEFNQSTKYPFCLDDVLNGTQDFRWQPWRDDWYSGVLNGTLIHLRQVGDVLEYTSNPDADLNDLLFSYFRLDDPIDEIYDYISSCDDHIAELVKTHRGLRILRQPDPWECAVAYICSAQSNVHCIKGMVEGIAWKLGCRKELDGDVRFIFPTWETIHRKGERELEILRLGLNRHNKILHAAKKIRKGQLNLWKLAQPDVPYDEVNRELMACKGIGPKIADCIALFALNKMKAFPVDSLVLGAVQGYFPHGKSPTHDQVVKWAHDLFDEYAGYANQFLYMGEREK